MPNMTEYHYELFADYFQFYLQDEHAKGDLSASWTKEAVAQRLALAPGTIGVGTVRNMTVPVSLEIHATAPDQADFNQWDHINECSLSVPSGKIVIAGSTDYFPEAARIPVAPGDYRARIYYGGLNTLSDDGLDGNDHYKIILWPAESAPPTILKSS